MSNNYNETLQANNSALEEIITQLNSLPDLAGNTIVGTWIFNDQVDCSTFTQYSCNFYIGESGYSAISLEADVLQYWRISISKWEVAYRYGQWEDVQFRTITITEEPTDEGFVSWLKANAVKQEETSEEEMPQIMLVNQIQTHNYAQGISETNPLQLTKASFSTETLFM